MALISTNLICHRLRALGVPKLQTSQMLLDVSRWVHSSGEEWTVERIKTMKQAYVMKMAGLPFRQQFFRTNGKGNPKGVWSWVFDRPNPEQALNILNAYSCFTSHLVTSKQRKKFFGSMQSLSTVGLSACLKSIKTLNVRRMPDPVLITDYYHKNTRCPVLDRSQSCTNVVDQWHTWVSSGLGGTVIRHYPEIVRKSLPMAEEFNLDSMYRVSEEHKLLRARGYTTSVLFDISDCVGKISAIQEPGYKLRAVATPNICWQVLLSPLNRLLQDGLRLFPGDCTFDQESGYLRVQEWLKQGKTLHSVDLSDATNMFPRSVQISLLHQCLVSEDPEIQKEIKGLIEIFDLAATGKWFYKENNSLSIHNFTRGQPLGLMPSFASFAFAHNTLVYGIALEVFDGDHAKASNSYVILGDDIVINDDEVARLYKSSMKNLGCEISESKTITSNVVAEFAGKVITPSRILTTYKWRPVVGQNFVDMARSMGPRSLGLLNRSQRKVVKQLAQVPDFIPPGLGWNPKGIPLVERMSNPLALTLQSITCDDVTEVLRPVGPDLDRFHRELIQAGLITPSFRQGAELLPEGDQPFSDWTHPSVQMYAELQKKDLLGQLEYSRVHKPVWYAQARRYLFTKIGDYSPGDPRKSDDLRLIVQAFSENRQDRVAYLQALGLMRNNRLAAPNPVFTKKEEWNPKRSKRHGRRL